MPSSPSCSLRQRFLAVARTATAEFLNAPSKCQSSASFPIPHLAAPRFPRAPMRSIAPCFGKPVLRPTAMSPLQSLCGILSGICASDGGITRNAVICAAPIEGPRGRACERSRLPLSRCPALRVRGVAYILGLNWPCRRGARQSSLNMAEEGDSMTRFHVCLTGIAAMLSACA